MGEKIRGEANTFFCIDCCCCCCCRYFISNQEEYISDRSLHGVRRNCDKNPVGNKACPVAALPMSNSGSGAAKVAATGAAHRAAAKGVAHGAAKTAMAAPKSKLLLATAKFTGPPAIVALTALWASGIVPSDPNSAVIHTKVRSPGPSPCISADAANLLYTCIPYVGLTSALPALMSLHMFSRPCLCSCHCK